MSGESSRADGGDGAKSSPSDTTDADVDDDDDVNGDRGRMNCSIESCEESPER